MATCSECTFLCPNKQYGPSDGRFWCSRKLEWHYADENECWRYCKAYSRSDQVASSLKEHSIKCQDTGCYLTTITCEILGLPDNNIYLQTLRKFRNETLQKNEQYKAILVEYDTIGPIIANRLRNTEKRDIIAYNLLRYGISKTVYYVLKKQDLKAIKTYMTMTKLLISAYDIKYRPNDSQIENADINLSGHGVLKLKR